MPILTCDQCKGTGYINAIDSMHDDKVTTVVCWFCVGKGTVNKMTEEEEADYWADYSEE